MFGLVGAAKMPAIITLLLFGTGAAFPTYAPFLVSTTIFSTLFGYFVSGFFPTSGGISNFILGL